MASGVGGDSGGGDNLADGLEVVDRKAGIDRRDGGST
jgi:hypothetical protein